MTTTFLTPQEMSDLTDVRTGKHGKTREQLQVEALKAMKIPYYISAIGRPKVARAVIEGTGQQDQPPPATWQPGLAA